MCAWIVARAWTAPLPTLQILALRRTLEQQCAFALVARQRRRALELGLCFAMSAELHQQIAAHARQQVIVLERRLLPDRIDEIEPGLRAEGERERHRAIEIDDRGGRDLRQRAV